MRSWVTDNKVRQRTVLHSAKMFKLVMFTVQEPKAMERITKTIIGNLMHLDTMQKIYRYSRNKKPNVMEHCNTWGFPKMFEDFRHKPIILVSLELWEVMPQYIK
ncbi:uncharacterized protein LOC116417395 [Nasonia vitripennis]|uniref:Uncharacterized protein n=1 Tax=Nasonia vitripennis TaxID=7425 RepID=A0A7M7QFY2_NASVI|nr:uncharacterized protein LOC116417395 [Nasonia vitripennis]